MRLAVESQITVLRACNMPACTRFARCACGQTFWSAGHRGTARAPPPQAQARPPCAMGRAARGDAPSVSGHVGLSGRAFRLSEYLHYARYTVQGLNLSRNGLHSPRRVSSWSVCAICRMPSIVRGPRCREGSSASTPSVISRSSSSSALVAAPASARTNGARQMR